MINCSSNNIDERCLNYALNYRNRVSSIAAAMIRRQQTTIISVFLLAPSLQHPYHRRHRAAVLDRVVVQLTVPHVVDLFPITPVTNIFQ
jgi:hypothetical protein